MFIVLMLYFRAVGKIWQSMLAIRVKLLQSTGHKRKKGPVSPGPLPLSGLDFKDLLQQGQHGLTGLVGLCQHGRCGLRDDLRLGQVSVFIGAVSA
jgi:hypothetical protein